MRAEECQTAVKDAVKQWEGKREHRCSRQPQGLEGAAGVSDRGLDQKV